MGFWHVMELTATSVGALASQWAALLSMLLTLVIVVSFAYVTWRTQSLHFLLRRFWLLVHGKKGIPDDDIRAFVDEQTSLHSFRLFSGVKVGTLENAKQLMAWCKRNNVPMSQISLCGNCFDPDERKVVEKNIPRKWRRIAYAVFGVAVLIVGTASFNGILLSSSLSQIKATERWVLMSEDSIRAAFPVPFVNEALDVGDCSSKIPVRIERTHLTEAEVEILCGLLKLPNWKVHIKEAVAEQRWSFLWLAIICSGAFYLVFSDISKWFAARTLLERALPENFPDSTVN